MNAGSAPRVVVVMPAQWPRALIRAALREAGYDAAGARDLRESLAYAGAEPERGPVSLLVIDDDALAPEAPEELSAILARYPAAETALISRATHPQPRGPWRRVLRRPVSVEEIVSAVRDMLPMPPGAAQPLA